MPLTEAEELELLELEMGLGQAAPVAPVAQPRSGFQKAVNIGAAGVGGYMLGAGPKIASAIGTPFGKLAAEGVELVTGNQAPSYSNIYKRGVEMYSAPAEQAAIDNPLLSGIATLTGGLVSGAGIAKTAGAKAIGNWTKAAGPGISNAMLSAAKKIGVGSVAGELGFRGYDAATAPVGEEINALLAPGLTPGAAIGFAIPAVGAVAGPVVGAVGKAVKPKMDAASKDAAQAVYDLAKKHGIDLKVSDLAGSNFYKRAASQGEKMPFSGADDFYDKNQRQINKAVTRTLGKEVEKITPEYLDSVRKELGADFEGFTKGKEFAVPAEVMTKVDEMANIASRKGYGMEGEAIFKQYLDELNSLVDDRGLIKGDKLDKFRRDLASVSRRQANSDIGQVASDFENAVVDIIADSDPAVSKAMTDLKYKYKNYKTILSPAARNQATGDINPATLGPSVQRVYGLDSYATGRAGDLGEIARVGQALRLPSSSGTAENIMAQRGVIEHGLRAPQYAANAMFQAYNRNPQSVQNLMLGGQGVPLLGSTMQNPAIPAGIFGGYLGGR